MAKTIAFIGLGAMGRPMAECLLRAGFEVIVVPHVNRGPCEELVALGARIAETPRDAAAAADVMITMVPDSPQVEEAVLGTDGVINGARAGTTVIDMSTISPVATRRISAALAEKGVSMVDAPVSGGPTRARTGELTIMAGGDRAAFDEHHDVLAAMGANITYVGPAGMGEVVKLVNQMIISVVMLADAEAFTFATKAGADPQQVREILLTATAGNYLLEKWLPNTMFKGEFEGGFATTLMHKDIAAGIAAARELGVPVMATALAQQLYQLNIGQGRGKLDYSSVSLLYQEAAGVNIAAPKTDE